MTIDLKQWERRIALDNGRTVLVRPIRPDDEALYADFFAAETADDLRLRFFGPVKRRDLSFFSGFTHLDYARAMAFIAIDEANGHMLGVARLHDDAGADDRSAEFAIIVRSDLKGHGLGSKLMTLIIDYAEAKRLSSIKGQVLRENEAMLDLCREFGFAISGDPAAPSVANVSLLLRPVREGITGTSS